MQMRTRLLLVCRLVLNVWRMQRQAMVALMTIGRLLPVPDLPLPAACVLVRGPSLLRVASLGMLRRLYMLV